jgi:hypothetical protein
MFIIRIKNLHLHSQKRRNLLIVIFSKKTRKIFARIKLLLIFALAFERK